MCASWSVRLSGAVFALRLKACRIRSVGLNHSGFAIGRAFFAPCLDPGSSRFGGLESGAVGTKESLRWQKSYLTGHTGLLHALGPEAPITPLRPCLTNH